MSLWVPLRHKRYRQLWIANTISNIGTWMQTLAAAWLMVSLSKSSLMVALVQTASSLPIFLFTIPAGTVADIVDRPKYLLVVNSQMALTAFLIAILAYSHLMTPWLLLSLTFILGIGLAFMWPAWQASVSGLVEKHEIPAAATLNGVSYNLASVLGPAIGGVLFKLIGASALFLLNATSFIGLIYIYFKWCRSPHETILRKQNFIDALIGGFKIVAKSKDFRNITINTAVILFGVSAFAALLPLIVKDLLHKNSTMFGVLMGCLGLGAVLGAFILPKLRLCLPTYWLLSLATLSFAFLFMILASVRNELFLILVIMFNGLAWITIISTLNAATQSLFSQEHRGRAISIYIVIMYGSLALGSYIWGYITHIRNIEDALLLASIFLITGQIFIHRWRITNV